MRKLCARKPEGIGIQHRRGFARARLRGAPSLAASLSDDAAMALVEATPADAVGADGRTPLHHAAAFARSAALARRLLAGVEPARGEARRRRRQAADRAAAVSPASEEQVDGAVRSGLVSLVDAAAWARAPRRPGSRAESDEASRAAVEADPDAATRPWLRSGLERRPPRRALPLGWAGGRACSAGEVAVVTDVHKSTASL